MKITHYLYNAFLIESAEAKIVIDPGQHLGLFSLRTLIPKSVWSDITHIVITHGDPDHYWQADRIAIESNAHLVCGTELTQTRNGRIRLIHPRGKGLSAWIELDNVHALEVGESVTLENVRFQAIKTVHGPIAVSLFGFTLRRTPGPQERLGIGSMGFLIEFDGKTLLNLGDSILRPEWQGLQPDVLMLPIGGLGNDTWTMNSIEALEAVRTIDPKLVIPCHYNVPFLWIKNAAPADEQTFKREVTALGYRCRLLGKGDELVM